MSNKEQYEGMLNAHAICESPRTGDKVDNGSHYRFEYKNVKLDPARILMIYKQGDPLLGAIVKKALCAGNRGHKDFLCDLNDIICAAERRIQMLEEDGEI